MSKELEALKTICEAEVLGYTRSTIDYVFENEVKILKQALTPPTADEVCKALSVDYKNPVVFDKDTKEFIVTVTRPIVMQYSITEYKNGCVRIQMDYLKPHLITLIGRFYEVQDV